MPHITIHVTVINCPPPRPAPRDFKHPIVTNLPNGNITASVTLCTDSPWVFPIEGPEVHIRDIVNSHPPPGPDGRVPPPISTGHEHGNGIKIEPGGRTGSNTIDAEVTKV
jgi:hypothetical protein